MSIALLLLAACSTTPTTPPVVEALASALPPAPAAHKFTFLNWCEQDIWVGSFGQAGTPSINGGGWLMPARLRGVAPKPMTFDVGIGNNARIWPRTECKFPGDGQDHCATGGCVDATGKFALKCESGGQPPAALVEWHLDAPSGLDLKIPIDYYDGSLVDGFNIPTKMTAVAGTFNPKADPGMDEDRWCAPAGCAATPVCPAEYADGPNCWSPCKAATRVDQPVDAADALNLCCICTLADAACSCASSQASGGPKEGCCDGGFGCTPYHDPMYPPDLVCDPTGGKNGGRAWSATAQSYIANVHAACPSIYAWQFDDTEGQFNCRKDPSATGAPGLVDYVIEFCPGTPA